ncbi:MAG: AMP-binding protein, partial [Devosia sp.]|nr:AMP-binding protein [Devosia sp.]
MRVETFLTASAARFGDKTALVAGTTRLSYAELDAMSDRLAAGLKARGVGRDDRVLVFLDNCWEAAVAIFATLKAGATFSPINASTKADKLAYIAANCDARAIISQPRLAGIVTEATGLGASFPLVVLTDPHPGLPDAADFGALLETPVTLPLNTGIDVDLAMLIYTSGSTGRPKGVMMTHRNIEAAATSITTYLENTPDDIILNVLPLAFDYGLYQLLMSVKIGATLVLEKSFAFPQAIFATLRNEKVTGFPLVPTMAAMILNMKDLAPGSFPDLRYISNTAAALPPAHIARLRELLPGTTIFSMYGLTECKRCTYLPPARLDDKTGSVGVAIPNTEAFVVDDDGRRVAPGEVGQLVI